MSGRTQPTGVNSASAAKAAHAWRLSTVTGSGPPSFLTARNSAAATVAAATEAVARPVTSNCDGSTVRGPVAVARVQQVGGAADLGPDSRDDVGEIFRLRHDVDSCSRWHRSINVDYRQRHA